MYEICKYQRRMREVIISFIADCLIHQSNGLQNGDFPPRQQIHGPESKYCRGKQIPLGKLEEVPFLVRCDSRSHFGHLVVQCWMTASAVGAASDQNNTSKPSASDGVHMERSTLSMKQMEATNKRQER